MAQEEALRWPFTLDRSRMMVEQLIICESDKNVSYRYLLLNLTKKNDNFGRNQCFFISFKPRYRATLKCVASSVTIVSWPVSAEQHKSSVMGDTVAWVTVLSPLYL